MTGDRPGPEPTQATRDFAVAVFVTWQNTVLLHWHAKLRRWLPPGGHIEPHEIPDDAARREVWEETGVRAHLDATPVIPPDLPRPGEPRPLCRPAGVLLTTISAGHEHVDLVYFATGEPAAPRADVGWFGPDDLPGLGLTSEIAGWCAAVLDATRDAPTPSAGPTDPG